MSMRMFKYPVPLAERVTLSLPEDANVLSLAVQGETPCVWALVDDQADSEERSFAWFGTGHEIPAEIRDRVDFVGTALFRGGAFVFHLFEVMS